MLEARRNRRPRRLATWGVHLRNAPLRRSFAIGFLILFAFIGTFTYVNFVLAREPLAVQPDGAGLRLLRLPARDLHHAVGRAGSSRRFGTRPTFWGALGVAGAGLPLLLTPSLPAVLLGLALVGVGTFFAQATATGFIGRAATADRGSASGIYLACYFLGGLVGTAVWGRCSTGSAGRPASPASAWRWRWRHGSPAG